MFFFFFNHLWVVIFLSLRATQQWPFHGPSRRRNLPGSNPQVGHQDTCRQTWRPWGTKKRAWTVYFHVESNSKVFKKNCQCYISNNHWYTVCAYLRTQQYNQLIKNLVLVGGLSISFILLGMRSNGLKPSTRSWTELSNHIWHQVTCTIPHPNMDAQEDAEATVDCFSTISVNCFLLWPAVVDAVVITQTTGVPLSRGQAQDRKGAFALWGGPNLKFDVCLFDGYRFWSICRPQLNKPFFPHWSQDCLMVGQTSRKPK